MASITVSAPADLKPADRLRPVRVWLYAMAGLVLLMVVVGGATRLTGSGLSITSWKPLSGTIPPLSAADWEAEFEAYKQIPQFTVNNAWMGLEDFKRIFWWEWAHRFLGRVLGVAFAVPFLVFLVQRRFSWRLAAPLATLFVLGGFQGALGWWMVSSGLSELTSVSQYRLAAHLTAAALLLAALVWVARRLGAETANPASAASPAALFGTTGLFALIIVQIAAGAFVAGLDAGEGYNTWPLMEQALVPPGLLAMEPDWRNLFENALTVQFNHRLIAYIIVAYAIALVWLQARRGGLGGVHGWLPRLLGLVLLQAVLGVSTLLLNVPMSLALGHQVLAFLLLGATVMALADMAPRRAPAVL